MAAGSEPTEQANPLEAARRAGLRYVRSTRKGIRRRRAGRGFTYFDAAGDRVRDPRTIERIKALVIPPAWRQVWICPTPSGHLQAVGRDERGRKQYLYHPLYREVRDRSKFDRLVDFAWALPRIRRRVRRDLRARGLSKRRILAAVVRLLDETYLRIGNREYARANRSFGLTTLLNDHVTIEGRELRFSFRGKSAQDREVEVADLRLARIVRRCRDLPGSRLFQYREDGRTCSIDSGDVNDYLRAGAGDAHFTAKDFRTWGGTKLAAQALSRMEPASAGTKAKARRHVAQAVKAAAARLGNTPATCRKYYVHPAVIDAYLEGSLQRLLAGGPGIIGPRQVRGLRKLEIGVLRVLTAYADSAPPPSEDR